MMNYKQAVKVFFDVNWTASLLAAALCRKSDLYIPRNKLRGLNPNSYNYVPVSDSYIPRIGLPIWLQQNRQTDPGNI
jgi:hypothetical protein